LNRQSFLESKYELLQIGGIELLKESMSDWRFSAALVCFGKQADRFSTYREDKSLEEKFELVSKVEGLEGVGAYYPS